jgi:hypothetical protein
MQVAGAVWVLRASLCQWVGLRVAYWNLILSSVSRGVQGQKVTSALSIVAVE